MTNDSADAELTIEKIRAIMANTLESAPAEAVHTWQRAVQAAQAAEMTLVDYATSALIEKLTNGDETLSVWVDDPDPEFEGHEERFAGHWLIEPEGRSDAMTEAIEPTGPSSWSVGIAETSGGRFALALGHYREDLTDELHVFDTFDQLRAAFEGDARVGRDMLDWAARRMEEWHEAATAVVWRDI